MQLKCSLLVADCYRLHVTAWPDVPPLSLKLVPVLSLRLPTFQEQTHTTLILHENSMQLVHRHSQHHVRDLPEAGTSAQHVNKFIRCTPHRLAANSLGSSSPGSGCRGYCCACAPACCRISLEFLSDCRKHPWLQSHPAVACFRYTAHSREGLKILACVYMRTAVSVPRPQGAGCMPVQPKPSASSRRTAPKAWITWNMKFGGMLMKI